MGAAAYDPFAPGPVPVGVRTIRLADPARGRVFPCELWYPARPGAHPLVAYSHHSGGHRRVATFLCSHLAGHGYAVAAMDHSEVVAAELAPRDGETRAERAARIDAVVASRVPDLRLLLDRLLVDEAAAEVALDPDRVGLVGHSFGGWSVLAAPDVEPRVRAVVAHAPGGGARASKPGLLPLALAFAWGRDVPTLYLAAEQDVAAPPADVRRLFDRTPASRRLLVLRRADHQHFLDDVERQHEAVRAMPFPAEAAWIQAAMRPAAELCPGEQAHAFVRGLTLAHLDATLRRRGAAERFLAGDLEAELAARGVEAIAHRP